MTYVNKHTGHKYNGGSITLNYNGVLFSGVPTENQLLEWGYEEYIPVIEEPTERDLKVHRLHQIQSELRSMDYLTSKELDGEDMTKYNERYNGDYKQYRRELRKEYNNIEIELKENYG